MRKLPAVLFGAALAVGVAGCSKPPTADIDAAKSKVEAVAADGAAYAPDALAAAQNAEKQLDAEVAAQAQKFAVFRSYDKTRELVTSTASAADQVQEQVATKKDQLRGDTDRMMADAERVLSEAQEGIAKVPPKQAAGLQTDAAEAETSLKTITSLLSAGELMKAHQQADAALQQAKQVSTTVEQAQAAAQKAAAVRKASDEVVIPRTVMADGKPLGRGTYHVRLTNEEPSSVAGETAGDERWVEFVRNGKVAGREVAVVLTPADAKVVAKSPVPPRNTARVEMLKGGQYLRVWLNRAGTNYLVYLPVAQG